VTSYIDYLESLSKKQLMVMLARQRHEDTQALAIVGMGCRYPAGIDDPRSFWALLREGRVAPTTSEGGPTDSLGRARWNLAAPDLAPIAELLRAGSYLRDIDVFDAEYFGLSDAEALHMDPQQRLLLEVTVQALADANLTRAGLRGQRVGIFVGTGPVEYPFAWLRNRLAARELSPFMGTGSTPSAAPGRIGLMLGVNGPALHVDTASSSMLSALHLAGVSLRRRECDLAIVGACNLVLSPFSTAVLAMAGMLSRSGLCRPFAEDADGHVRAEGCGVLVLKRHQDAMAERDLAYALVRGSAVSQHGDRLGLSVASTSGQKAVIELALRAAGIGPLDVQYVEAQANGSRLGGVVEAEALAATYGRQAPDAAPLYVGSCKANLGYLEIASGAPGLMKAALALAHGEIPPHVGADDLDRSVAWSRMALRFARAPTAWPSPGRRTAGVSAFGLTGTNAHVIMESVPDRVEPEPAPDGSPALLVVSAHNDAALAATARRLHDHLAARADWTHAAVCRTLALGRDLLKVRATAIVRDRAQLLAALAQVAALPGRPPAAAPPPRGIFLVVPVLDEAASITALAASRAPGFEALDVRLRARADAMQLPALDGCLRGEQPAPPGAMLAWALAWIDLVTAAGLELAGGTFGGPGASALVELVTGQRTGDEICARWTAGTLAPTPGAGSSVAPAGFPDGRCRRSTQGGVWEVAAGDGTYTLRRAGRAAATLTPAALDVAGWLSVLAEQLRAGADVRFSGLADKPRLGLCRLPGPAFTGKSYWPAPNLWS
jgi:3-oxoacyl-[acyl-carrier-protein] synthase II